MECGAVAAPFESLFFVAASALAAKDDISPSLGQY